MGDIEGPKRGGLSTCTGPELSSLPHLVEGQRLFSAVERGDRLVQSHTNTDYILLEESHTSTRAIELRTSLTMAKCPAACAQKSVSHW